MNRFLVKEANCEAEPLLKSGFNAVWFNIINHFLSKLKALLLSERSGICNESLDCGNRATIIHALN